MLHRRLTSLPRRRRKASNDSGGPALVRQKLLPLPEVEHDDWAEVDRLLGRRQLDSRGERARRAVLSALPLISTIFQLGPMSVGPPMTPDQGGLVRLTAFHGRVVVVAPFSPWTSLA